MLAAYRPSIGQHTCRSRGDQLPGILAEWGSTYQLSVGQHVDRVSANMSTDTRPIVLTDTRPIAALSTHDSKLLDYL